MRLEGILLDFGSNQVINQLNRIAIHSQKLRSGQPGPPASVPADILPRPRVLEAHPGRTRGMLFWTGIIHDICVCVCRCMICMYSYVLTSILCHSYSMHVDIAYMRLSEGGFPAALCEDVVIPFVCPFKFQL